MKIAIAVLLVVLAVAQESRTVIRNRESAPSEWILNGAANAEEEFSFSVGLKQRNLDVLESTFWEVSSPSSSRYREFMTYDQIMDLIAPPENDRNFVKTWLVQHGVARIEDRQDNLLVHCTVGVAERIFNTTIFAFSHRSKHDARILRQMGEYSLPSNLWSQLITIVAGVSDFPPIERNMHFRKPMAGHDAVIPQVYTAQYQAPSPLNTSGVSQGVAEFQSGDYFTASELQTFAKSTDIHITPLTSNHIINPLPPAGVEGTLDIQYLAGIAPNATSWFWTETNWLYEWATAVSAAKDKPSIFSISYGWSEAGQCSIDGTGCSRLGVTSEGYVSAVDVEFQKIGLQGVSILVSSGDSGAHGRTDPGCTSKTLLPDYPGTSPFVTAVGATQLVKPSTPLASPPPICKSGDWNCVSGGTEEAVSYAQAQFTSGGGFNTYKARPAYQNNAVTQYLQSGVALPPASMFNSSNRGYPDIAAIGDAVLIYSDGVGGWGLVGGTSCSSPAVAAFMSALNSIVVRKTGKPLGFLNGFLYQMYETEPSTFTDITVGDNKCTEDGCASTCKGFNCAKGWDPVTGLGVPNIGAMISYVNAHF